MSYCWDSDTQAPSDLPWANIVLALYWNKEAVEIVQTVYSGPFSPCSYHALGSKCLCRWDILTREINSVNSIQFLLVFKEMSQHKRNFLPKIQIALDILIIAVLIKDVSVARFCCCCYISCNQMKSYSYSKLWFHQNGIGFSWMFDCMVGNYLVQGFLPNSARQTG